MPAKKPTKATAKPSAPAPAIKPSPKSTPRSVQSAPVSRPSAKRAIQPPAVLPSPTPSAPCVPSPWAVLRAGSKQVQLLGLLNTGATMTQMSKLTGWQAHTIRATISVVFRKRLGLTIEPRTAPGGTERIYQVTALAA